MSANKSSHKTKHLPQAKEQKDKYDHEDHNAPSKAKDQSCSEKGKNAALRRMVVVLPAKKTARAVFP